MQTLRVERKSFPSCPFRVVIARNHACQLEMVLGQCLPQLGHQRPPRGVLEQVAGW